MSVSSVQFQRELSVFGSETEAALEFFYAWDATRSAAARNSEVASLLGGAPLYWRTVLSALLGSSIVAVGRIFDPDTKNHSVAKLLSLGFRNIEIFSPEALAERKRKDSQNADIWLPEYLKGIYVPTVRDFQRLKSLVHVRRSLYEAKYRPLRHQIYSHRAMLTSEEISALFAKTNLAEYRKLLVFLEGLHRSLWGLFYNGHKPTFRPRRFSAKRMVDVPSPRFGRSLQESLVHETNDFLSSAAQTFNKSLQRTLDPSERPLPRSSGRVKRR